VGKLLCPKVGRTASEIWAAPWPLKIRKASRQIKTRTNQNLHRYPLQLFFRWRYLLSADRSINASLLAVQYNRLPAQPRIANMNKLQFKGSWNEIKGKLKQKYAQLTDDDLTYAEGKDDELVGKLQKKLGKSAEEVRQMLEH
jgi:uncharacterized protein YjbJ (UPF0337 family)